MTFETGEGCAVYANCQNAGMQCWACTFPDDALAPTEYLPRDPKILHPETQARLAARKLARKAAKQTDASKRGKASKQRGDRFEREIAKATGGHRQPGSGRFRGNLSNDVETGPDFAGLQVETKFGLSYPVATLYNLLEKTQAQWCFIQGQQTTFILTTLPLWMVRKWDGMAVACAVSKQVGEWEGYLLDTVEKPQAVICAHPNRDRLVLQLIPYWIQHMAPEPVIDAEKIAQAKVLLEEAFK